MSGSLMKAPFLGLDFFGKTQNLLSANSFVHEDFIKKTINGHCLTLLLPGMALLLGMNKRLTKKYRKERFGNKIPWRI